MPFLQNQDSFFANSAIHQINEKYASQSYFLMLHSAFASKINILGKEWNLEMIRNQILLLLKQKTIKLIKEIVWRIIHSTLEVCSIKVLSKTLTKNMRCWRPCSNRCFRNVSHNLMLVHYGYCTLMFG